MGIPVQKVLELNFIPKVEFFAHVMGAVRNPKPNTVRHPKSSILFGSWEVGDSS